MSSDERPDGGTVGAELMQSDPSRGESRCHVLGCRQYQGDGHVMCRKHWNAVGVGLRSDIYRAFNIWRRQPSPLNLTRLRGLQQIAVNEVEAADAAGV